MEFYSESDVFKIQYVVSFRDTRDLPVACISYSVFYVQF